MTDTDSRPPSRLLPHHPTVTPGGVRGSAGHASGHSPGCRCDTPSWAQLSGGLQARGQPAGHLPFSVAAFGAGQHSPLPLVLSSGSRSILVFTATDQAAVPHPILVHFSSMHILPPDVTFAPCLGCPRGPASVTGHTRCSLQLWIFPTNFWNWNKIHQTYTWPCYPFLSVQW